MAFVDGELAVLGAGHLGWSRAAVLVPIVALLVLVRDSLLGEVGADIAAARETWREFGGDRLAGALMILTALTLTVQLAALVLRPMGGNDGIAIWLFKAKLFWTEQGVDLSSVASELQRHLDYPLLYPLAVDAVYSLGGGLSEHLGRLAYAPFTASLVIASASTFRRLASPRWTAALVLLTLSLPVFAPALLTGSEMGYADFPLACVLFASACALIGGGPGIALAIALGCVAAAVKLEGQAYLFGLLLVSLAMVLTSAVPRPRISRVAVGWLLPLIAIAGWWPVTSYVLNYHLRLADNSIGSVLSVDSVSRLREVISFAIGTLSIRNDYGWLLLAMVLSLQLMIFKRTRAAVTVGCLLLWQSGVYLVAYVVSSEGLLYLLSTTIFRLYMQLAALVVLLLALALEPFHVLGSTPEPEPQASE
jgi:hypothetical protein